jgi:hypothetical protein
LDVLTREDIRSVRKTLDGIVGEVCGACQLNCCLQGTMVGSDDARRIAKAACLSPAFRARLIEGLAQRGAELRRDLEGLERTARLLRTRFGVEQAGALARLEEALNDWHRFCEFLERDFRAEPADLKRCLLFSGLRATTLRALRAFPGGESVLPALAGPTTSFKAGRRGVQADRCLFHLGGCLVTGAKPHKCADFYCGSDPGLVHEVVDRMTFDDFVLAHVEPRTRTEVVQDLATELALGSEYVEPKIIVGADEQLPSEIAGLLAGVFPRVSIRPVGGRHFDATLDLPDWGDLAPNEALVLSGQSVDAVGVYEMAVLLVRARARPARPMVILAAEELRRCAGVVHDLWRTRAMSQPISALNLWGIVA